MREMNVAPKPPSTAARADSCSPSSRLHVQVAEAQAELAQLVVDHLPDAGSVLHEDERLSLQLLHGQALPGALVAGGDGEDDLVPVEGLERDAAMAADSADDPELELATRDLLDHGVGVRDGQRDVHLRMEPLELAQQAGQDAPAGPRGGSDLESALQLALGLLSELREQLLLEREKPLRASIEAEAGLGRLDAPTGAVEQLLAEALLERPDLQADRGLRHAELVGGLREAAALDHGAEGYELPRVHKGNL